MDGFMKKVSASNQSLAAILILFLVPRFQGFEVSRFQGEQLFFYSWTFEPFFFNL